MGSEDSYYVEHLEQTNIDLKDDIVELSMDNEQPSLALAEIYRYLKDGRHWLANDMKGRKLLMARVAIALDGDPE